MKKYIKESKGSLPQQTIDYFDLTDEEIKEIESRFTSNEQNILIHFAKIEDAFYYMDHMIYNDIRDYNECNSKIDELFNNPDFEASTFMNNLRAIVEHGGIEIPHNLLDGMKNSLQDALSQVEDLEKICGY